MIAHVFRTVKFYPVEQLSYFFKVGLCGCGPKAVEENTTIQ